jgi:hypothetical protein
LKRLAASAYIDTLSDRSQAKSLLASKENKVLLITLLALKEVPKGVSMTPDENSRLDALLYSDNLYIRREAAALLGRDPTSHHLRDRIESLINVMYSVTDLPNANEKMPSRDFTYADIEYYNYVNALASMPNASYTLRQESLVAKGVVKKGLIIASAMQGDKSMRSDILELIKDPKEQTILRIMAVGSLAEIGLQEDINFVKSIAENDTVVKTRYVGVGPSFEYFPVREAARQVLERLEKN